MNADDRTIERGHCPRDGLALSDHPRCQSCGLLLGPGHYAVKIIQRGERVLCEDCATREGSQAAQGGPQATKASEQ